MPFKRNIYWQKAITRWIFGGFNIFPTRFSHNSMHFQCVLVVFDVAVVVIAVDDPFPLTYLFFYRLRCHPFLQKHHTNMKLPAHCCIYRNCPVTYNPMPWIATYIRRRERGTGRRKNQMDRCRQIERARKPLPLPWSEYTTEYPLQLNYGLLIESKVIKFETCTYRSLPFSIPNHKLTRLCVTCFSHRSWCSVVLCLRKQTKINKTLTKRVWKMQF